MNIHYVCGSRADFGLMRLTLQAIEEAEGLELGLIVTGQATNPEYGDVVGEIGSSGLRIEAKIPVTLTGAGRGEMALAFAEESAGLAQIWKDTPPELVMLLGDRSEMLAAASIAFHLGIPTVHIHGGERSGTLDEGLRHAISKLATYHFVASQDAQDRLFAMGEDAERIFLVGGPGLVGLAHTTAYTREKMFSRFGIPTQGRFAMMVFHPVIGEDEGAYQQCAQIIKALANLDLCAIILRPNSDAGGAAIDRAIGDFSNGASFAVLNHLERSSYLRVLAAADVLVGNSSSGIIESASLGTPAVNVGSRQDDRLRNANTVDCAQVEAGPICDALSKAFELKAPFANLYGDGKSDKRIVETLRTLDLSTRATAKRLRY